MYALPTNAEGACHLCVPPAPGIESAALGAGEAAALGASESTAPGAACRSFYRDCTTLTPLRRPVAVSLADPSGGPVLAHSSTALPRPAVPSGSLSGLHLPSFSTNSVSGADLQDAWADQFTPGGQRVTHCSCTQTGRHLATFTRQPGSSLYTLSTVSPAVAESGQVAASGQVFAAASKSRPETAPCSCRLLSHKILLWHHRLGHPSLPRLQGMASRVPATGLPRSLPPLPPGPAPICVPCVEGRQRAAPHSSEFPLTEAPLQTLHMDVWGPARVHGQGHERYFMLVVDEYSRYTTFFPLRRKGEVTEGIRQTFTLPASLQKNGIAERRIGMVTNVAHTFMIHAAAPHFLWPFAVEYAAHQLNLLPRVSMPETTPSLRWTGKVGDGSVFRVWGSRAFVRDLSADKLSPRAVHCVFLGFPPDAPGWQFYHPTSRRVVSSQDVTFDESVPYYRLFPYRTAPLPPPAALPRANVVEPVEAAIDYGAARGAEPAGAGSGGAELERAEPGGAESGGAECGCAELGVADPGGDWCAWRWSRAAGAGVSTCAGGPAAAKGPVAAGAAGGSRATGRGGARTGGTGAAGPGGAAGAGAAGGARAGGAAGAGAAGGTRVGAASAAGASGGLARAGAAGNAGAGGAAKAGALVGAEVGDSGAVGGAAGDGERVPLPSPPGSSLPALSHPKSDSLRAASPTVTRLLASAVTYPFFESSAASSLVAELVEFAAHCCLDCCASHVAESESVCPPFVGGECALSIDVFEDKQEDFECFAATVPHLVSMLIAPEGDPDAPDIPTPRSYAEAIERPYSSQW
ncbi:unnamed protein product [Closterium sp. NIES-65]|nr:unnamed protein product [Closterium sp. NIES-65]